ncbi:unnamed protein product [Rangifer tarandus platyrhynchus]|uniref:Uncharacterized protein n=1 Tax=Rangifer tarandus platyrhynchus TaxID=3082113 RepID=A0ABN8YK19_RANTA|nr:unnamed protein product [Rangifer tarandus platyrhynchus]
MRWGGDCRWNSLWVRSRRDGSCLSSGHGAKYPRPVVEGFPVVQWIRNPSAVEEIKVQSLGWEDPPGEGMATHSSILAWRIPWTEEEPGRLQSMGSQRVRHDCSD